MILLNPKQHSRPYRDERSREIMRKTIEFFESKGKRKLKEDDRKRDQALPSPEWNQRQRNPSYE